MHCFMWSQGVYILRPQIGVSLLLLLEPSSPYPNWFSMREEVIEYRHPIECQLEQKKQRPNGQ
jgi:hypothetical protein